MPGQTHRSSQHVARAIPKLGWYQVRPSLPRYVNGREQADIELQMIVVHMHEGVQRGIVHCELGYYRVDSK